MQCSHSSPFLTYAHSLAGVPPPAKILRNLRNLPPLKAPGLDGYHALFFQHNWSSLGSSIVQVIQDIFEQLLYLQTGHHKFGSYSKSCSS